MQRTYKEDPVGKRLSEIFWTPSYEAGVGVSPYNKVGQHRSHDHMARLENRSQLMNYLGAKQKNAVWSWCAVNEEERKVYLSAWTDTRSRRDEARVSYIIQEPEWGVDQHTRSKSAARKDQDEKLALIFNEGYEAYGYFIEAKDKTAHPREIQSTSTSFIFSFDLERQEDGSILGYPESQNRNPMILLLPNKTLQPTAKSGVAELRR